MFELVLPFLYRAEYWFAGLGSRVLRRQGNKRAFSFELGEDKKHLSMAWF